MVRRDFWFDTGAQIVGAIPFRARAITILLATDRGIATPRCGVDLLNLLRQSCVIAWYATPSFRLSAAAAVLAVATWVANKDFSELELRTSKFQI